MDSKDIRWCQLAMHWIIPFQINIWDGFMATALRQESSEWTSSPCILNCVSVNFWRKELERAEDKQHSSRHYHFAVTPSDKGWRSFPGRGATMLRLFFFQTSFELRHHVVYKRKKCDGNGNTKSFTWGVRKLFVYIMSYPNKNPLRRRPAYCHHPVQHVIYRGKRMCCCLQFCLRIGLLNTRSPQKYEKLL